MPLRLADDIQEGCHFRGFIRRGAFLDFRDGVLHGGKSAFLFVNIKAGLGVHKASPPFCEVYILNKYPPKGNVPCPIIVRAAEWDNFSRAAESHPVFGGGYVG